MKNKQQSDKHVVRENVLGAMCLGQIICTLHYEKQTTIRQTCSARKCAWGK